MKTPIADFISKYADSGVLRLHTPGHKGYGKDGFEKYDITEVDGADELFDPHGIIKESEDIASQIFGCPTYYSTEGSSLCVRAMIFLISRKKRGSRPVIAAGRNVHRSFISACAVLDADVIWIEPEEGDTYCSVTLNAKNVENAITSSDKPVDAVFITTPDYSGRMTDVKEISKVCKKHGVMLAADAAHGAYLAFAPGCSLPVHGGADLCCTSAHKTLPALTGTAYLHTSAGFDARDVKNAMSAFASSSPSYLLLRSLDLLNGYLISHTERLSAFIPEVDRLKKELVANGYALFGDEPLKITLQTKKYGYTGREFAAYLGPCGISPEFYDPEQVVLLINETTGKEGLEKLGASLLGLPKKAPLPEFSSKPVIPERVTGIRDAFFAPSVQMNAEECCGRISASFNTPCPPAVPFAVCGERIDENVIKCLSHYGIKKIDVTEL